MDTYCVMGNPVEHSRSPWIHARFAELTGQTLHYDRRLVPLGGFAEAVAAFRAGSEGSARGCNVTVPFKFDAAALAQHHSAQAACQRLLDDVRRFAGDAPQSDDITILAISRRRED